MPRTFFPQAPAPARTGRAKPKRRKVLRDNIQGITKPAIRRLARRGGVKRISGLIYEETRGVLKVFLENVIRDAVTYTEHARRKTVSAMDVVYALKRQGRTLYGFEKTGSYGRDVTEEQKEREAVERRARSLAFQAHQRGQPIPSNAGFRQQARQQLASAAPVRPTVLRLPAAIGAKMALLEANGVNQEAGVRLCNQKQVTLNDGSQIRFEAIARHSGIRGLAAGATHAIVVKDSGRVVGLALLCVASGQLQRAASLTNSSFFDGGGSPIDTAEALRLMRGGNERVHELLLLCGAGYGSAILEAAIGVCGGASGDLLFTNAAFEPRVRAHLWENVY